jgi:hypothetical protein
MGHVMVANKHRSRRVNAPIAVSRLSSGPSVDASSSSAIKPPSSLPVPSVEVEIGESTGVPPDDDVGELGCPSAVESDDDTVSTTMGPLTFLLLVRRLLLLLLLLLSSTRGAVAPYDALPPPKTPNEKLVVVCTGGDDGDGDDACGKSVVVSFSTVPFPSSDIRDASEDDESSSGIM